MTTRSAFSPVAFAIAAGALALVGILAGSSGDRDRAAELRNRGFGELENEQPAAAETTFRELAKLAPDDPLPQANLAIALLRQQKTDEALEVIARAEAKAPKDPRLIAIRGEILTWSGKNEAGLEAFREAARLAPNDLEAQYTLYRTATTTGGESAGGAAAEALDRLARLRPENLVVLLQIGKSARESGDRTRATGAYLRVRELIWQAPPGAEGLLEEILSKLEANDLEGARVPSLRLENVLKVSPMYRESLRELQTGIQGIPLTVFRDEPPVTSFGAPAKVEFRSAAAAPGAGLDVRLADLTGDGKPEILRLTRAANAKSSRLLVLDRTGTEVGGHDVGDAHKLLVADLDNDGHLDVLAYGGKRGHFFAGSADGRLTEKSDEFGLASARGTAAVALDFDIEGDLDLFVATATGTELYRNSLSGALEPVGAKSLPGLDLSAKPPVDALASDLDRDGDLDLLLLNESGTQRLDNLRQGRFAIGEGDASAPETSKLSGTKRFASADLDNDGWPDLVTAGIGVQFWRNERGRFERWDLGETLRTSASFAALTVFDADNDGRLDIAVGGPSGLAVLARRDHGFAFLPIDSSPLDVRSLDAGDVDGDGDLDLLVDTADGLVLLDNQGGNRNNWLTISLRGLVKGNSKNNFFGVGSTIEVRAGTAYQFREVAGEVTHFGLGEVETPDLARVVWTNGVPQNRFEPTRNQSIVEEQLLKGSCPFVYSWDGEGFAFETDLLWGAPAGLPVAEGIWAGADAEELVRLDFLQGRNGLYELRLTEELWEAAFIDYNRLWVVDHPVETEVASSLKVVPGRIIEDRVFTSRGLRPVAGAWDASGREVTDRVRLRDEVYADGWRRSAYQGVAREPWTFEFDLGDAPAKPVRFHLDGWIFPADASLNLALDQRSDFRMHAPRLEMRIDGAWVPLLEQMGFPAGKTKTMVVETPALPEGVSRLRIVSNQWLSWDRIAWTVEPDDGAAIVRARLEPARADLRFRGFSRLVRKAPNAPHNFEYHEATTDSPWLPFPGGYTRYGDVRELLRESDSRSVVMGPGDEIELVFDGTALEPPAPGMRRSFFLESHGWDKDADKNTYAAAQVEPLPFRGMSGYPYGEDEAFPDTPLHREYLERYQTRVVE